MSYQERPRPTSPTPPTRSRHLSDVDDPRGSYSRSTESRSGQRQPRVRWFVALFDYDPQTMSPNPDTADEELPFQEGDLIKIYGGKDQDGFYKGEANGRMGFVPCNMVSEVHMDSDVAETGPPARSRPPPHRGADGDAWAAGGVLPPQPKRMVALYDYDPAELSPNPDPFSELAFSTGDVIYVYGDMDEDGFFFGELHGLRGLVPSNFLTEAPPDYAEGQRRTPHGAPMQAKELREPMLAPRGGGPGAHQQQQHQPSHQQGHHQQQGSIHGGRGPHGGHQGAGVPHQGAAPGRHAPADDSLQWQQQHPAQHAQQLQQHQQHPYAQQHRGSGGSATMETHYEHRGGPHDQRGYAGRPVVGASQRW